MIRRIPSLLILSLLLVAFTAMTTFAARTQEEASKRTIDPLIYKSLQYAFPDATNRGGLPVPGKEIPRQALGSAVPSVSPGTDIGDTWYDYQRNGSMGRMIEWGVDSIDTDLPPDGVLDAERLIMHFSWMFLPSSDIQIAREMRYDNWDAFNGVFGTETGLQPDDEYAGYGGVQVTGSYQADAGVQSNRAVVGCHNNLNPPNGPYQTQVYFDFGPGYSFFNFNSRVPDTIGYYCQWDGTANDNGHIWPRFKFVEGPATGDTIIHVMAQKSEPGAGDPQAVMYFRGVYTSDTDLVTADLQQRVIWDYPPYCIDTIYDLSHDVAATNDGKVALCWTANLPEPGDCDTCSAFEYWNFVQLDNDIYYQISTDFGQTFQRRVNVTKNVDGEEGYRPYIDLSCMFDSQGDLHIVWHARYWPADANSGGQAGLLRGRIFHVSSVDTTLITTAHNSEWDQTDCNGGAWQLNSGKMSISECDGKMYVLFVQWNDPDIMMNDCADDGNQGFPVGAANGDLYITISDDWGVTWDLARNLTNSHTPGCDSALGTGGPCDNDHWPSMTRFGAAYNAAYTFPANTVVPTGSTDPQTYYLDVQYVNDHSAGGIVQDEGWWHIADIRWFRLPCVEPIRAAILYTRPTYYGFPSWSKHGVQHDTSLVLENGGNCQLAFTITPVEISPVSGWLGVAPNNGTIGTGANSLFPTTASFNLGGSINNPGTIVHLDGLFVINWAGVACPPAAAVDTVPVDHWVTDTLLRPIWDTLSTSCTRLSVANTGNFGQQGIGEVNMDYVDVGGDCDTNATVYLFDGSPVVCYVSEGDTTCSWSIFGTTFIDTNGFVPVGDHTPVTDMGNYEVFESGKFVTSDSLIAVEKIWYAPKVEGCSFVIEKIKVYLNDTLRIPPTGVRIGEAIDWDIPADTASRNGSGADAGKKLIYQYGCEEDDTLGCLDANRRWGGMDFLDSYKNGAKYLTSPHGAYVHQNFFHVYPLGGFSEDTLYMYMENTGYTLPLDSSCGTTVPATGGSDLHMVMTFDTLPILTKADTFEFWVSIVSHYDGSLNDFLAEVDEQITFYCDRLAPAPCGCCNGDGKRGQCDGVIGPAGEVDVADLTYLVAYLFTGGPIPPCDDEGNVDGIIGPAGKIDVADLTYLVAYLFTGGADPVACP